MPQLGNYQVGSLKSIPKLTRINGDDDKKAIYRNVGNAYPMLWSEVVTHSGTETVLIASGTKFHGYDLVSYVSTNVTPMADPGAVRYWVDRNADGNVYIKSSASMSNVDFTVTYMVGNDFDYSVYNCSGRGNPAQSLP